MRKFVNSVAIFVVCALALQPASTYAQSTLNLRALAGLMPQAELLQTDRGRAALASNYAVTLSIQAGTSNQPTLLPFSAQQQQALRDAFITFANASGLADGLGTTLGPIYQKKATYASSDDGKTSTHGDFSPNVATVLAYTSALTASDAGSGKFFFADASVSTKSGMVPVSPAALGLLTASSGTTDVFGKAYAHPAANPGNDRYGNSRPFQTEPILTPIAGPDYFGIASSNDTYLNGPTQDLTASPSFPSGHTTYGYTEALVLAILVPQRYPQMIVRAAEYGNDRIILGAHYAMDVIAGRTLALYDVAHFLAEDPAYIGQNEGGTTIAHAADAIGAARAEVTTGFAAGCAPDITACASQDAGRFADGGKDLAFYDSTQTYGLHAVYDTSKIEDVAKLAPEAGFLLTAAFPSLTLKRADDILTATEGPGGGFLDNGSAFGVYSRLDLVRASIAAAAVPAATPVR